MPWRWGQREGLVGSILPYSTGEVLGETSSPGQVKKIASRHDHAKIERGLMLMQELLELLHQAARSQIAIDRKFASALPEQIWCKIYYAHWGKIMKLCIPRHGKCGKEGIHLINHYSWLLKRQRNCTRKVWFCCVFKCTCNQWTRHF